MRTLALSILLAAGSALAGVASAQEAPTTPAYEPTTPYSASNSGSDSGTNWDYLRGDPGAWVQRGDPLEVGVAALRASEFTLAEDLLGDALETKPYSADANFYMGV